MNYLTVGKFVFGAVAGLGADKIVSNIVKATTPATVGAISKIAIKVGGVMAGMYVGDKIAKYTIDTVDKTVASIKLSVETAKVRLSERSKV